ncbi:small, acid-soluble spore protein, H family [Alkalibacillus almallahensis]|uniref:small, acid-soluble spore protein, H family n=1 Tax=Alkalibacillus almallahensis TaxID=1379154 RepID=UPI00141D7A2D|nr:small, acid-soluble spore protein, H family [Alkalibacillus almallahensis]NIK11499.1 small acid-soluble spore protein H (minor) [Alkalibacillus almallahensis]
MNLMQAKDIKDDPNMRDVVYNGKYVYVKEVNDDTQKATIFYVNEDEPKEFEVDLTELTEED